MLPAGPRQPVFSFGTVEYTQYMIHVLHFEDDPHVAAAMREAITNVGMQYTGYTHPGPDPIKIVQSVQPSLVLSDINMPVMDGMTLAKLIKTHPATSALPIVLLTSFGGEQYKRQAASIGVDMYLVKGEQTASEIADRIATILT